MKKIYIILGLIVAAILTMGNGCKVETSTSFGLTIEGSDFVEVEPEADGRIRLVPRGSNVFERGEDVNFVLLNVGKFKRGDDGLNWFDMDMEVKDPDGNVILSQQSMLGERGHVDLPNDIAAAPYATFRTTTETTLKPGNYRIKLTIYDRIGDGSASKSKSFTLE